MTEDHGEERQRHADGQQHDEERGGDDDLGQHEGQHDQPHHPGLAWKLEPGARPRGEDAERGRQDRGRDRDDQRVLQREAQRLVGEEIAEPVEREALQRKGDDRPRVEGEDRQQNDRRIEEDEVEKGIALERGELHFDPRRKRRLRNRKTSATAATASIAEIAIAEPSGLLSIFRSC
ncbi:hypothetical protein SDC9_39037 [bioreactor metagenome]|uniref:Uncharacterized protein n=1 Tax=bioreactor metagenome TaxID=1076179 RepID=A0A644VR57_9ZZZZ